MEQLAGMVDTEPGLKCPKCGAFSGQWVRDILARHMKPGTRLTAAKKKEFQILPPRNSTSPACPSSTSRPSSPTRRNSNPGRGRPTVVAIASASSSSDVAQAVPPSVSP